MADLSYNVRVNTQQAQQAISGLRGALGGLAAAFSVREITRFGDAIVGLQNKLRTLTPNLQLVDRQFRAIADIAQSSRTDLAATGDLYFRIARNADQLGISLATAADITDTLSKGMASSGLSAAEAAGPLLQIGQALQSGRFQGDELRSVLEGMPIVATALAREMGVTVGELRKLGTEGKITGDVFVRAMQNSREAILEAFGRTTPTVAQSFEVLSAAAARLFDTFNRNTGATSSVASAIISIADNLEKLAGVIDGVGPGLRRFTSALADAAKWFVFIVGPIVAVIALFKSGFAAAIGGAIMAVVGLVRAIGSLPALLRALLNPTTRSSLLENFRQMPSLAEKARTGINALSGSVGNLSKNWPYLAGAIGGVIAAVRSWLGYQEESAKATQAEVRRVDNAIDAYNRQNDSIRTVIRATQDQIDALRRIGEAYEQSRRGQISDIENRIRVIGLGEDQIRMIEALRSAENDYNTQALALREELIKAERELAEARENGRQATSEAVDAIRAKLAELDQSYQTHRDTIQALIAVENERIALLRLQEFATQQAQRAEDELIKIQREMVRGPMTEIERQYHRISDAADDAARAAIRAEEARRGAPLNTAEIENYYRVARVGVERLQRATEAQIRQQRSFSAGWAKAYRDYADAATNAATRAQNIFSKTMQGMEDLIVNFAKTGKFEFRDFVNSILEELLRSQIRELMASIFNPSGGIFGGLGDLFGSIMGGGKGGGAMQRGNSPNTPLFVQQVGAGSALGSLGNILGGGGSTATPGFGGPQGGGFMDTIGSVIGNIGSGIGQVASTVGSGIGKVASGIASTVGSIASGLGGFAKSLFGGFFANGGQLPAGKFGVVGERGPEFITGPANITPMTGTQVTYNINAVDAQSFQSLLARDPQLIFALTEQGRKSFAGAR